MNGVQVTFENLCMVYNGYTQTPEYFIGPGCTRAVVPQSFSFQQDALITWDVKHGNTMNPWTLPHGKPSATVVGQLAQSSISAVCDPSFHRSAFFKFCVNNAANLLSVIEQKCCRDLVCTPFWLTFEFTCICWSYLSQESQSMYAIATPSIHNLLLLLSVEC